MSHSEKYARFAKPRIDEFDWSTDSLDPQPIFKREIITLWDVKMGESNYDRRMRMLRQLSLTCQACTMCELGRKEACKNDICRDPHVLSNMNPVRVVVVGQNPGWNELEYREPFIGAAGKNFDNEIAKHGMSRADFYITNIVKCWTPGNSKPDYKHVQRCSPFLQMEINLIRPHFVVTLGAVSFGALCPGVVYSEGLKKLSDSSVYGVKVFAVYHPSPLNMNHAGPRAAFQDQIATLCNLIKKFRNRSQENPE